MRRESCFRVKCRLRAWARNGSSREQAWSAILRGGPIEFRPAPLTARVRWLDPVLSQAVGGLTDICAPVEELASLAIQPARVWVVENVQTGLAFEPLSGSAVVMGLGYSVSVLSSIPWVQRADCVY